MSALAVRAPTPPRAFWSVDDLDLLASGRILDAFRAAERLRTTADGPLAVGALLDIFGTGDDLARMLSLRALASTQSLVVDHTLADALAEPALAEHAAWALSERPPVAAAVPTLARLVASGGFPAMPAQLALERWGGGAGSRVRLEIRRALARCSVEGGWARLAETLSLVNHRAVRRSRRPLPQGAGRREGLRIAQILLRGSVDAELEGAGAGDGGGVVTLLVQLAAALGRRAEVERSLIVARRRTEPSPSGELVGPGSAIVRLPYGPSEDAPVEAMWEHRAQIERAVAETVRAHGPIDIAHLRYADAGTFAAARALRRAGVPIAFTVAPDPHALISERDLAGELTRAGFAAREAVEHNLFRLRLVDELTSSADALITLPRAGGHAELEQLLGRSLPARRTSTVAEGIALEPIDRARAVVASGESVGVIDDLHAAVARLAEHRLGLPIILSVGRFHPVKGFPRLVEAWAGDPELANRFNLVLAGGDLDHPSHTERAVLDGVEAVAARFPAAREGLVLLGARPHEDVARLLALARHGRSGTAAANGIYVCASDKEEFGVAILEALGCGLTVVAPTGGGPGTYVEHGTTGILVEPGRVDALRTGMTAAAELARGASGATRAESLVRERFSIEPMAESLSRAYANAAAPR